MSTHPTKRWFSVQDFHRMVETGILTEDDRTELIAGVVISMSPFGSRHAACVKRFNALLSRQLLGKVIIGVQDPIQLDSFTEPQPDLSILQFRDDFYAEQHPRAREVLLLIEVSDLSLSYDRDTKLPLYAQAEIPEVWIVDLTAEKILAYQQPKAGKYEVQETYTAATKLTSVAGFPVEINLSTIFD
ncbi:MAG TPA: Uma2 family endonuclease [Acidobacteriota bacterium]|nr:Uma2 family endonuclease [Acidobacteriota bacterium]HNJ39612.1 Uma2 family endonuclease [Acidobacteriota bacterium]